MKQLFVFLVLGILSMNVKAQNETDSLPYKNLNIWSYLKEYEYHALYIDANGDTITNEKIIVKPTGKVNPLQKTQTLLEYKYNYSKEDSARIYPNIVNANKFTRKYHTIIWRKMIDEGAGESKSSFWIHPFRINQYVLTELAPFPEVYFPITSGDKYSGLTFIQKGWGTFKGRTKEKTIVGQPQTRTYSFGKLDSCYEFKGTSIHNKLGENTITYYYQKDYGFTEMHYHFYNGQRIDFILDKVTTIGNESDLAKK